MVTGTWLLFSHILGMSSSHLTNIFQRGSNHQPVLFGCLFLLFGFRKLYYVIFLFGFGRHMEINYRIWIWWVYEKLGEHADILHVYIYINTQSSKWVTVTVSGSDVVYPGGGIKVIAVDLIWIWRLSKDYPYIIQKLSIDYR